MEINKKKKLTAALSIFSNVFLTLLKIAAGIISGSLSIISEAIHSASDLFASVLTFFSVMKSSEPADDDHPYGHGKYEDMSGFIEGILIIFAAVFIIYEATKKIILGTPVETENSLGIIVMLLAVIMNIIVSSLLFKVAKESNSISLYADGEHLRTDVYSSFGVLIGLILIKITGYHVLDPVIAILVAVVIYRTGYSISKKTMKRLLDYSLPEDDIKKIQMIVSSTEGNVILKEHSIKARQSGPSLDIDLILQFPEETPICKCHQICDKIERQISLIYPNCSISIHSEPDCYQKDCQNNCSKICNKV
jgi:cation diffusion facilitator family transporter